MIAMVADGAETKRLRGVLVAASAGMLMVQIDFFALNLALPQMARDLHVEVTDLQWVISGYMLALGAFLIPGGRLGDILGRRRVLIAGIGLFVGSSVTAIGPFLGGLFTDLVSWRAVFLINIPFGLLAIAMLLRSVEESRDSTVPRQIDFLGLLAVALGIGLITLAVDRGEEWGWFGPATLGVFLAGLLLLVAFVEIERRVRWPLVDLSLFRNRPYVVVTVLGTISNVAFVSTTLATTLYLQQVRDFSALGAGAIFLACSAMLAFAGPLSGRLGERFVVARVIPVAMGVGAAGLVVVALDPGLLAYMAG